MTKHKSSVQDKTVKEREIKDWHAIAFITAAVLIFFRDILLMNAFMWEDFLYQFYQFRNFAAVSLANGEIPLWNPYTFNGMPFQADIQSAVFYIPNLLLTIFVSGDKLHFFWVEFFVILHYMVAGISMYYLMKSFKVNNLIALFSSFVYMFSGFMITHGIHQIIINHVAWLPLIFLLFKKALDTKRILYIILCGLILGHSVLAGFPQLSLYIFFLLFLFLIFNFIITIKGENLKSSFYTIIPSASIVIIALLLTAIQLLPTIELAPLSARAEITYEKSQEGTLAPQQLITFFIPKFFGETSAGTFNYWGPGQYWHYWETCIYLGIAALVMILISFTFINRVKYVGFFGFVFLFGILYALGDYFILHKFFFHNVPGFHLFRNPGRMSLWITFSGAILSGFGLNELLNSPKTNKSKIKLIGLVVLATGIIIWLLVQGGIFQSHSNPNLINQIKSIAVSEAHIFIGIIVTISVMFFALGYSKISPFVFTVFLILIQFVDLNIFGFSFNNGKTNPTEYFRATEQLVNILKRDGKNEYFRINSRQDIHMILDRNQGMVDKIFMMEGYTPLSLQRIYPPAENWGKSCDLLNAKYRIQVDHTSNRKGVITSDTYLPRTFFVYDYRIIQNEDSIKEYMSNPKFDPKQIVVLEEYPELDSTAINDWTSWNSEITSYNLNSISLKVSTPRDGILVLSEIYFPGWNAYVNGIEQKVLRANWNLRAIKVSTGEHNIELRFEPKSFKTGSIISLLTIGLCFVGIVYSLKMRK